MTWSFRKPLINFSPKANLRHQGSYSLKDEFLKDGFKEVLDDPTQPNPADVRKVFLCSGKIYFDLAERKEKDQRKDIALIRLEQLYPLPEHQLNLIRLKYNKASWFWIQEEPMNMGAASYLKMNLNAISFGVIARQASASTATGYNKIHQLEQAEILDTAFSIK
jgi:2-oxoglutarate dehydrogenase E1 component